MSHNDSPNEETKKILKQLDENKKIVINDSGESKIIRKKDGYDDYYSDEREKLPDGEEEDPW